MASIEEIRSSRLNKLNVLIKKCVNPYPATTNRNITCKEAGSSFDKLAKSGESKYIAGRIMSVRAQGKISFLDIDDGTGRFQVLLKSCEPLPEESYELFEKAFD